MPTWTLWKVSIRLALILMTCSLFVCKEVRSPQELRSVPLGLPVPFLVLDARRYALSDYPQCFRFGNRHADPMRLKPLAALASVLLLTLTLVALARVLGVGWSPGNAPRSGER